MQEAYKYLLFELSLYINAWIKNIQFDSLIDPLNEYVKLWS